MFNTFGFNTTPFNGGILSMSDGEAGGAAIRANTELVAIRPLPTRGTSFAYGIATTSVNVDSASTNVDATDVLVGSPLVAERVQAPGVKQAGIAKAGVASVDFRY